MNITKAVKRTLNGENYTNTIQVIINGIEWSVPEDLHNRMYQELMKQQREGKITIEKVEIQG
jgi:hypothetical protein